LDAIGGTRGVAAFVSFFYPTTWIFFFIPSSSLSIFIFAGIHTHILIWALASGVGSFLVLLPFLNLWEALFFTLCPFLITHDKLLLSTPKFSLFHREDGWVALYLLFTLPPSFSRPAWLGLFGRVLEEEETGG